MPKEIREFYELVDGNLTKIDSRDSIKNVGYEVIYNILDEQKLVKIHKIFLVRKGDSIEQDFGALNEYTLFSELNDK